MKKIILSLSVFAVTGVFAQKVVNPIPFDVLSFQLFVKKLPSGHLNVPRPSILLSLNSPEKEEPSAHVIMP